MNEKILDTNIFTRYLIQEIPDQFEKAKEVFGQIEQGEVIGLVSILVIDEMIWVLEQFYGLKRKDYLLKLLKIFHLNNIRIIEAKKEIIINCLETMKENRIDFTDIYLSKIAKKGQIFSFDKDFEKL